MEKKNWRKNIDIEDLEVKNNKMAQEKIVEKGFEVKKNDELFVVDTKPTNKFTGKKTELKKKKKGEFKPSKWEERKVKRKIISQIYQNPDKKIYVNEKENQVIDLWGEDPKNSKKKASHFP